MTLNSQKTGATVRLVRYKAPTPIGYRGPFRNMGDIYKEYRNTLMNKGPYKAYFESRASYGESPRKFTKTQYSPEHRPVSEGERKEQHHEIQPAKTAEAKPEIKNENEQSQKTEQQKETTEKQNEISTNEKIGLPEYQQDKVEQTDIKTRNRPSPYQDRAEMRW